MKLFGANNHDAKKIEMLKNIPIFQTLTRNELLEIDELLHERILDDFIFLPLTIGRRLHVHPLLSLLILFLRGTVACGTGLVLALPVVGVVSVVSDMASQIVTDQRLIARFWITRRMANTGYQKLSARG